MFFWPEPQEMVVVLYIVPVRICRVSRIFAPSTSDEF
jgi:hypothetical protein